MPEQDETPSAEELIASFPTTISVEGEMAGDFWAVWCPQERVFVREIWLTESRAQSDADIHNRERSLENGFNPPHTAKPYHVIQGAAQVV